MGSNDCASVDLQPCFTRRAGAQSSGASAGAQGVLTLGWYTNGDQLGTCGYRGGTPNRLEGWERCVQECFLEDL